jgi:Putative MetA-pathway of phenol degradation
MPSICNAPRWPRGVVGMLFAAALGLPRFAEGALAQSALSTAASTAPDPFHELETKYIFGFTEGADIGAEGEQSIELETTTELGRRGGHYGTIEQEIEYESVPTQSFGYELSAHMLGYSLHGVEGEADAQGANFSGLSTELRYLVIGRGPGSPFGVTIVAEPEWARVDDAGRPITDFSSNFRGIVDTELISNRLYGAINLIYAPDVAQSPGQPWLQSSTLGATGAMAYRFAPKVTAGAELEYYRDYDGFAFQSLQGQALYLGPTLQIQFTGKIMLSAAWSTQVAGHATGETHGLDLTNFPQQRGNLRVEFEF